MKTRAPEAVRQAEGRCLSVIIPVYREEKNIERCLKESTAFFDGRRDLKDYEIILVADRSGDRTIELIEAALPRHPRLRLIVNPDRLQKGGSVREGVRQARFRDLYLFYDADLSTPLSEFDRLLPYLADQDIVIASRSLPGARVEKSFGKTLVSDCLFLINRIWLGVSIRDTQCGFKLFRGSCYPLFEALTIYSSAFDIELLFLAARQGLKIKEVPVTWKDSGFSNFNHWRVVGHFIRDLTRIRLNAWRAGSQL